MQRYNQPSQKLSTILPISLPPSPSSRMAGYASILFDFGQQGLGCRGSPMTSTFALAPLLLDSGLDVNNTDG